LNENSHGLLRQHWSKSSGFKKVTISAIQDIIVNINERPSKKLNYKTLGKLMPEHTLTVAFPLQS
jgi:IS30 family transposase